MHVPEWLDTPFVMKIDNKGHECDLEDEHTEIHVDIEAKTLFKNKNNAKY